MTVLHIVTPNIENWKDQCVAEIMASGSDSVRNKLLGFNANEETERKGLLYEENWPITEAIRDYKPVP